MGNIKAGVIVKNRFCKPSSSKYNQYINYMDRPEAVRTEHTMEYDLYADYMGNPEKTTGLFTAEKNRLTEAESKEMKKRFAAAQEKGSLMWQTVISFDNSWLKENGLLHDGILDEKKIYEVTRKGMRKMLQKEGLENVIWSGSIHYNTDNIHIHVATVEPDPMRKVKEYQEYEWKEENGKKVKAPVRNKNGKLVSSQEMVGRFKLSSIEACKSTIANEIIKSRDINHKINEIIRGTIIKQKKDHSLAEDKELAHAFFQLYKKLPECDKKMWNYSTNLMKSIRPDIDELSRRYIDQYHKNDFQKLVSELKMQSLKYQEAYSTKGNPEEYVNNKIKDLYKKLGNCILKELREYDNEIRSNAEQEYRAAEQAEEQGRKEKLPEPELEDNWYPVEEDWKYSDQVESSRGVVWSNIYKKAKELIYEKEKFVSGIRLLEQEPENALALYELGTCYNYGRGVEADEEKAGEYFKGSLQIFQDVYESLTSLEKDKFLRQYVPYRIAKQYAYGQGVDKDYEQARKYYEEAAGEGNIYAMYSLGNIYYYGQDVEVSYDQAIQYFNKSAIGGNAYAAYRLASMYEKGVGAAVDQEKAQKYYRYAYEGFSKMLSKSSDDMLGYKIAMMELKGQGTEKNIEFAEAYLKKAVKKKNYYAMYQLAKINLENGDIESLKESEKLLMKAAERFDYAQYALGDIYTDKESPLYQMEKGIKWLEKARNNGNEYASYKLGKIYSDMHSEYYDLHKSIGYLEGSTENNYVKELLGKCYLKLPEKEQQRKGVDILRDAMEKGASESTQYVLGKYLAYQGEQKSEIKEGMQMLTELAENNYEYAQVSLGIFYMKKEPGEQNFELSKYWLGKAKDQGNAFAEEILKNVEMRTAMYAGKKRSSVRLEYIRYGSALNKAIVSLKRSMNNEYEQRQNEWEHELLTRLPEKEQEYER